MTPRETAMAVAREIANAQQIKLISATLLSVDEIAAIILTRYAPLEQELAQYKAVAKELAEIAKPVDEHLSHHFKSDLSKRYVKETLTKFNNLEAKDKKG